MIVLRSFIFLFFSLGLHAAHLSNTIFNIESAGQGIVISCPQKPHPDFLIEAGQRDLFLTKLEMEPFAFVHSYTETFYPFREELLAISSAGKPKFFEKAYKQTHEHLKRSLKVNPLFLCSECGCSNESACPLSRHTNKEICPRNLFLSKIINEQRNPDLGIIFYASGGNWFEIQAMSKFLLNGAAFEKVFFIDPDNGFTLNDLKLFDDVIGKNKGFKNYTINIDVLRRIYRTVQTAYFIWAINAKIKLFFYTNFNGYVEHLSGDRNLVADCLISMDPIDGAYNLSTGVFGKALEMKPQIGKLISTLTPDGFFALNYRLSGKDNSAALRIGKKADVALCNFCGIPQAINKCSNCKAVSYCDRTCQIAHWPTHKSNCK